MNAPRRRDEWRARIGLRLAHSASKKRHNLIDRWFTKLLRAGVSDPEHAADDFMKDDLVDAGVEFDSAELEAYERGAHRDDTD